MHDCLAHPPDGVGDELDVVRRVEAPGRFQQPQVAFVDQVEERDAEAAVALRVRDHEPEVGLDEPLDGRAVPVGLDAQPELALFFGRQARQLRDFLQVGLQGGRFVRFVAGLSPQGE